MEALSFRRYYSKIKKIFARVSKQAILSLVFLFVVLANAAPAFAEYEEYKNLFVGNGSPSPYIEKYSFFKQGTIDYDVRFRLRMGFDIKSNESAVDQKEAAWEKIVDVDDSSYKFILRICATADTSEANCYFSQIPYRYTQNDDGSKALAGVGNATTKIYHSYELSASSYSGTVPISTDREVVNDKFDVIFPVDEFSQLSSSGKLINPISADKLFFIGNTNSYRADAWYCARKTSNSVLPQSDDINDSSHRQFNNLCGENRPFFKIATSEVFTVPASVLEAQSQTPSSLPSVSTIATTGGGGDGLPSCGTFLNGTVMGCIAQFIYYVIYWPIAWFAGLMGNLFDFFLGYSLSDSSYRADFAVRGWQLVRDISNIFFIIILVWTGLSTVFGNTSISMKRVVPNLILNALLINFSLFATRVVIDISNVTARIFYNSIHVCDGECIDNDGDGKRDNLLQSPGGFTSVSSKILAKFNPQKIFNTQTIDQARGTNTLDGVSQKSDAEAQTAGYFIIVTIVAAFVVFAIAMMFWKTTFFFLGRVVGLYVAMIFAPFAFLSRGNIPLVSDIKEISWDSWLKDLTNYAMLAPIFVFFLYIISSFLDSDFLKIQNLDITSNFFETVMYITIPMLIVYIMIKQGVDIAKKFAGNIGNAIQSQAQKVIGFTAGAALGGSALLGGRLLGGAATAINKSSVGARLRDKATTSWFARNTLKGLNNASAGSYDVRQTTIGKTLFKRMDINTDQKGLDTLKGVGLGLSTAQRKGGFEADAKRRAERLEKNAKLLEEKMSDDDIKKYNKRSIKRRQANIDSYVEGAMQAQFGKAIVEKWKMNDPKKYEDGKNIMLKNTTVQKGISEIPPAKEIKSVAELNADRRKAYLEELKKPGIMTNSLDWLIPKGAARDTITSILETTVGATIGAAIGRGVIEEGNKLAIKKIGEQNKITENLEKIKETLDRGFKDLIALEDFQSSPRFVNLTAKQQDDIINHGRIQFDPNFGADAKENELAGKGLYDILDEKDRSQIDARIKQLNNAKTDAEKENLKKYQAMVKTIEGSRYDTKQLNKELEPIREKMKSKMKDRGASKAEKDLAAREFLDKIKEVQIAVDHLKMWRDIDKYTEEQNKKLKGEDNQKPKDGSEKK